MNSLGAFASRSGSNTCDSSLERRGKERWGGGGYPNRGGGELGQVSGSKGGGGREVEVSGVAYRGIGQRFTCSIHSAQ